METTKAALENERKIQQLQMQAISALWKKVSTLQPTADVTAGLSRDLQALANGTGTGTSTTSTTSTDVVQDLAKTCTVLTNQVLSHRPSHFDQRFDIKSSPPQVQQLQGSMRDIIQCMTMMCKIPSNQEPPAAVDESKTKSAPEVRDSSGTQTEIVAVHTPQVEDLPFPFANKLPRPSTLMLIETNETVSSGCGGGGGSGDASTQN